jgi:DNA-directed RNA polymerase specialized sigma24 family protein
MENETAALHEKLDMIIRLLAHQVATQHETIETKAFALNSLGLQPAEIAHVCGTTAGTISVKLAHARKKAKTKRVKMPTRRS